MVFVAVMAMGGKVARGLDGIHLNSDFKMLNICSCTRNMLLLYQLVGAIYLWIYLIGLRSSRTWVHEPNLAHIHH